MMMTFFNMNSPGLVILPTHRVVYGLPSFSADSASSRSARVFQRRGSRSRHRRTARHRNSARSRTRRHGSHRRYRRSRSSDAFTQSLGTNRFAGLSLRQQSLDVVQLHKCLLEGVLNISEEAIRNLQNISYHRDAADALAQVRSGTRPGRLPDEPGSHAAGPRYCVCRRGPAAEVHRFLSQAAERADHLRDGIAEAPQDSSFGERPQDFSASAGRQKSLAQSGHERLAS